MGAKSLTQDDPMDSIQVGKAVFVKESYTTLGIEPRTYSYPGRSGNPCSVCWVNLISSYISDLKISLYLRRCPYTVNPRCHNTTGYMQPLCFHRDLSFFCSFFFYFVISKKKKKKKKKKK